MKKNVMKKRKEKLTTTQIVIKFFMPTKWKLFIPVVLYFSGWVINYPIYYFYNNYPPITDTYKTIYFVAHIIYLYLLAAVILKVVR